MVDGSSGTDGGYEAHRAAFAAFAEQLRTGDHHEALAAAQAIQDQMADAENPDLYAIALNCVGLAQFELGDFTSAAETHQRAADLSQRPDVRGFALLRANLAKIEAGESASYPSVWEGGSAPARLAVLARGEHPHLAPAAGLELGRLLRGERHFLPAIRAYRAVIDSGHPWFRPRAAAPLAELLREAGDPDGAARLLEHATPADAILADDAPDMVDLALTPLDAPDAPPFWLAPVQPAIDHYRAGDLNAARAALRTTTANDWRHAAHQATTALAGIELLDGDRTTARHLLDELAETADFTHGPRAAVVLTILDTSEETDATATANALAHYLLRDQNSLADLEALARSEHPAAGMFAALLSDLLDNGHPSSEAAVWRARAAQSGDKRATGYTAYLTAISPAMWDNPEDGVDALGEAHESASAVSPWATLLLAEAGLANIYWSGDSLAYFHTVLESGHRALMPRAAAGLFGSSPADSWQAEERYELAGRLLTGDLPAEAVPPLAWLTAENAITYQDDLDTGRGALQRIPDSDPEFGGPAQAARLLLDEDIDGMRTVFERLARWDRDHLLDTASESCMSVLWKLPDDSPVTLRALRVLADLGDQGPPLVFKVLDRLTKVCQIQGDLEGELAAREKSNLRLDGHPGDGILETARRLYLAGDLDQAIDLYQRVNAEEYPEARGKAVADLAVLLRHQDRNEEAEALPTPDVPAQYCLTLGTDLQSAGRIDEAILAWELITDADDAAWAARANYRLGRAHADRGGTDAAIAAYQKAGASQDSLSRGLALHELGRLHQDRGDLELAKEYQQRGLDVGNRLGKDDGGTIISSCQLQLGRLATLTGDTEEARRIHLDMVNNGDRHTGAMGAMMLGGAAKKRRDVDEARRWYQWVIDSRDLFQQNLALAHLGELYYWVGDRDQSREFYQRTVNSTSSNPELVAEAAYRLGEMAAEDGANDQAVQYLERARDTGDATFGPQADDLLNRLTGNQ